MSTARRQFETIVSEAKGRVAMDHIMGHSRNDTGTGYHERISDERLNAASDRVRKWVFGKKTKAK